MCFAYCRELGEDGGSLGGKLLESAFAQVGDRVARGIESLFEGSGGLEKCGVYGVARLIVKRLLLFGRFAGGGGRGLASADCGLFKGLGKFFDDAFDRAAIFLRIGDDVAKGFRLFRGTLVDGCGEIIEERGHGGTLGFFLGELKAGGHAREAGELIGNACFCIGGSNCFRGFGGGFFESIGLGVINILKFFEDVFLDFVDAFVDGGSRGGDGFSRRAGRSGKGYTRGAMLLIERLQGINGSGEEKLAIRVNGVEGGVECAFERGFNFLCGLVGSRREIAADVVGAIEDFPMTVARVAAETREDGNSLLDDIVWIGRLAIGRLGFRRGGEAQIEMRRAIEGNRERIGIKGRSGLVPFRAQSSDGFGVVDWRWRRGWRTGGRFLGNMMIGGCGWDGSRDAVRCFCSGVNRVTSLWRRLAIGADGFLISAFGVPCFCGLRFRRLRLAERGQSGAIANIAL